MDMIINSWWKINERHVWEKISAEEESIARTDYLKEHDDAEREKFQWLDSEQEDI